MRSNIVHQKAPLWHEMGKIQSDNKCSGKGKLLPVAVLLGGRTKLWGDCTLKHEKKNQTHRIEFMMWFCSDKAEGLCREVLSGSILHVKHINAKKTPAHTVSCSTDNRIEVCMFWLIYMMIPVIIYGFLVKDAEIQTLINKACKNMI